MKALKIASLAFAALVLSFTIPSAAAFLFNAHDYFASALLAAFIAAMIGSVVYWLTKKEKKNEEA